MSVRVGVSSCLLGAPVRYDGQHKRDAFLNEELAPFVTWVAVCPEVEVGMGVPRPPVRLVRGPRARTRMLGVDTGVDWTARMEAFAARRADALAREDLAGYVLKAKSPSCGLDRVKVHEASDAGEGQPTHDGVGLFARALMERLPNLPVEEEGRLHDARLRENFIERVFAYARVRRLWEGRWTTGDLVAFHTAHKMQLLAHSTDGYRALGRLVGGVKTVPRAELRDRYEAAFMAVLRKPATPGRHANVLMHMMGHLKAHLDEAGKAELLGLIEDHRVGLVPLIVPVTMLRHHVRRLSVAYLLGQTYLEPHPKELMLRNHV
ncbi:MAG TPA: DUF523 and DUF1722 domain-containing protein [Polyangia bacterium]|nr:DUF523 and DUF1722 domain-containing protein [Polyangia bacterium]